MKYIGILIILSFSLISCSWGDDSPTDRGLTEIWWEWFSLEAPADWTTIDSNDLPLPKSGDLVLALSSAEEKMNYLNNLVVLRSESTSSTTSSALVKSNIGFLEQNMANFDLISEQDISFLDESKGTLILFSWRYNSQTPRAFYLQTAQNCGDKNFFLTLSLAQELESYSPYEYILKTLSCK